MLTNVVFHGSHLPLASKKVFARQTIRYDVIAFFKTMRETLFRWPRLWPLERPKLYNAWALKVVVGLMGGGGVETARHF